MKRRHHELPRHYLRGFCELGTGFIWVYEQGKPFSPGEKRETSNPHRRGIHVTALRRDRYAARGEDGRIHFRYEPELQRKERLADDVIRKVRNHEPISADEKEVLARYIGLMMRRLSDRDVDARPRLRQVLSVSPMYKIAQQLADAGQFGKARELLDAQDRLETEDGQTELLRESMLIDFDQVHSAIMGIAWRFLVAPPERHFITTDNPVVFDRHQGLRNSPLLFPLSSTIMLDASRFNGHDLTYEQASILETRKFNAMVMTHAVKEIYSARPDEWILARWQDGFAHGIDHDA